MTVMVQDIKQVVLKVKDVTQSCESTNFVMDECKCELVCSNCGLVIDDEFIQYDP